MAWADQSGRCFYCERPTWLWESEYPNTSHLSPLNQATREHLVKHADGGSNEDENIVMACGACNSTRGEHTSDEWLAIKESEALRNFDEKPTLTVGSHLKNSKY